MIIVVGYCTRCHNREKNCLCNLVWFLVCIIIVRVRFIVFTSLTLIVLFVFIYCISFSHQATVFQ